MSFQTEVLADSPLVWYRFSEPSGATLVDSSGNGRDGTYLGTPGYGAASLVPGESASMDFSGDDYADVTNSSWMNTSTVTVEAVFRPDVVPASTYSFIASRDVNGTVGPWWLAMRNGKIDFATWGTGGGVATQLSGATTLVAGTTYHVAATYDGAVMKIYLNGVLDGQVSRTDPLNASTTVLRIGNWPSAALPFDGRLQAFALYGPALSSTRIAAHAAAATAASAPAGSLAATLPVPSIALAGTYALPPSVGSLAAALPVPTVALSGTYDGPIAPASGVLTVTLPATTAALAGAYVPPPGTGFLAGTLPLPTLALAGTYTASAIVGTDTTSDVSLGYGYDGVGEVGDNLTPASIPAGVNLAPIRRVHQSLPAPTLVNGRPT